MRIFRELPRCAVTSRLVLQGNFEDFGDKSLPCVKPDYSIFSSPTSHPTYQQAIAQGCTTLISKEELGHEFTKGECDFDVLPDTAAYELTLPVFLVRDPIRVFDSWMHIGWSDLYSFFICYKSLFRMLNAGPDPKVIIYEQLVCDAKSTVAALADYWGIEFDEHCLKFKSSFGDFVFNGDPERAIYQGAVPDGLFDRVESHGRVEDFTSHGLLSALEIEHIEAKVGGLYLDAYGSSLDGVRAALSSKTWFGFDLDDTLHEFRTASAHASSVVFQEIHDENPEVTIEELGATYREILRSKTASAFTDGRTSTDYRRERFSHLLQAHGFAPSQDRLQRLLTAYQQSLRVALRLKAGALQLLQRLKTLGKKVIVVTEGPRDAQEWTVAELGLQSYIDILITTNEIGKSKVDGLFPIVLDRHNIAPSDIIYVGDNEQRDIIPTQAIGMMTALYDERRDCRFENPQALRLNSLPKLKYLVG